jgi:hypothetical protein
VSRRNDRSFERILRRVVNDAFWICAQIHRNAARQLAWLGRAGAWVLKPFPWSCRFGAAATVMALLALWLGFHGQDTLIRAAEFEPTQVKTLTEQGFVESFRGLSLVARYVCLLLAVAAVAAFLPHRLVLWLLKAGGAAFAAIWLYLFSFVISAPSALYLADAKTFDNAMRHGLWIAGAWAWAPGAVLAVMFLLTLCQRPVAAFYGARDAASERLGDRVAQSLKSPRDPRWRSSSYWSFFLHMAVLFLPLLLSGWGALRVYGVPKGSGSPVVQMVKVKRIEKKEKPRKKKFVLNMDSPVVFYRPDIDESEILKQVEQETQDVYVATSLQDGKLGKGGGKGGGWPSGMEGAKIGFLRLEYKGGDWDQDMGVNADYNLLIEFHKITGFKIADNTDHIGILELRRFRKHRAPPFVFLTGSKGISCSKKEVDALRWYCLEEGGMIFADNGGGSFNQHFRALMRRCFPELDWVDIANDDILYRQPFIFPSGAPPLWHHSGMRAAGLKHNERWIVYYHQGDVNDAWKTGHSGASEQQAMQAYRLGVNIINYAFNQYMHIHYGD